MRVVDHVQRISTSRLQVLRCTDANLVALASGVVLTKTPLNLDVVMRWLIVQKSCQGLIGSCFWHCFDMWAVSLLNFNIHCNT